MDSTEMYNGGNSQERKELTIKFSRKLARLFTGKDGTEYAAIAIPNADSDDKRAWEEFVLPAERVHDDYFGSKSLWAKIPEDGTTTLSRSVKPEIEGGEWTKKERSVDNVTLKSMVEAYKQKNKTAAAR